MGSSGKKRTTFAKMNREQRLRERRAEKEARKAARKLAGPIDHTLELEPVDSATPEDR
jgi:hypothetical protein